MGSDDGGGDDEEELEVDTQLHYVQICTLRNQGVAHSLSGKIHSLFTARQKPFLRRRVHHDVVAGTAAMVPQGRRSEERTMERSKKVALVLGATALALGAGFGVTGMAAATTATPTPTPTSSSPFSAPEDGPRFDGGAHGRGHGRGHGAVKGDAAALAAKLGVDQAKVEDALRAFREANHPPGRRADGTKPDNAAREAALAASLAKSLGIDEAKVKAALEELRTQAQADRAAALKGRLDQAVKDGTLTQAEADAVAKAVEKGVIGGR
jgi:pyruvate/2-oxoglutarate dehydrogenase complex dihydrolipoamide acyltransferase (E2) component